MAFLSVFGVPPGFAMWLISSNSSPLPSTGLSSRLGIVSREIEISSLSLIIFVSSSSVFIVSQESSELTERFSTFAASSGRGSSPPILVVLYPPQPPHFKPITWKITLDC